MINRIVVAEIQITDVFLTIAAVLAAVLIVALAGLALIARRIRRLNLPPDAGALEILRAVPLSFVVLLDLLDLSLDVFSAPVSWAILGRFGLHNLRQATVIEALIPGTQLIPTMTLAWLFARLTGRTLPGDPSSRGYEDGGLVIDHEPGPSSQQRRHQ